VSVRVYLVENPGDTLFAGVCYRNGGWMFWNGVEVEPEEADVVEAILNTHSRLRGFHYERRGNVFRLPPVYGVSTI
jgi:hypothetical protein